MSNLVKINKQYFANCLKKVINEDQNNFSELMKVAGRGKTTIERWLDPESSVNSINKHILKKVTDHFNISFEIVDLSSLRVGCLYNLLSLPFLDLIFKETLGDHIISLFRDKIDQPRFYNVKKRSRTVINLEEYTYLKHSLSQGNSPIYTEKELIEMAKNGQLDCFICTNHQNGGLDNFTPLITYCFGTQGICEPLILANHDYNEAILEKYSKRKEANKGHCYDFIDLKPENSKVTVFYQAQDINAVSYEHYEHYFLNNEDIEEDKDFVGKVITGKTFKDIALELVVHLGGSREHQEEIINCADTSRCDEILKQIFSDLLSEKSKKANPELYFLILDHPISNWFDGLLEEFDTANKFGSMTQDLSAIFPRLPALMTTVTLYANLNNEKESLLLKLLENLSSAVDNILETNSKNNKDLIKDYSHFLQISEKNILQTIPKLNFNFLYRKEYIKERTKQKK